MGALTQDEKDKIRDEAVAQWWKDWFAADYSWEGLKQYPWQGWKVVESKAAYNNYIKEHGLPAGCPNKACQVVPADFDELPDGTKTRDATLQDYWRDQENKLEGQEGGKQYTIAHLPVQFENGSKSWKADCNHEKWNDLSKLVTPRINCGFQTEVKFDWLGDHFVTGRDGRSNFHGCILAALLEPHGEPPPVMHITLRRAALLHSQYLENTSFESAADFSHAQFSDGEVNFYRAKFSGGKTNFINTQFCGEGVDFGSTEFSGGDAYFIGTKFFGPAYFARAQFTGGDINFVCAKFSGGNANFQDAHFSGGNSHYRGAEFTGGRTYFNGAKFSGGNADFGGSKFSGGRADFSTAQFSGGDAHFTGVGFIVDFSFVNATFDKRANFKNTVFPPATGSENAFHGTEFFGASDFSRNRFKDKNGNDLPQDELHFPFNAFANANFKDRILLTQRGEKYAKGEFDRAVQSIKDACNGEDEDIREDRWVALESGCTTLKQAMESISDKNRAQRYFKFELLARQQRPKTSRVTKFMTRLYGWAADYGGSIGRPLLALFAAWVIFTLGYLLNAWAVEVETAKPWQMLWGAMDFSATHIFRPLFIWSKNAASGDSNWVAQYHKQLSAGGWLTVKIFATLQSFLSITLLFLFGLATKRKFQMS